MGTTAIPDYWPEENSSINRPRSPRLIRRGMALIQTQLVRLIRQPQAVGYSKGIRPLRHRDAKGMFPIAQSTFTPVSVNVFLATSFQNLPPSEPQLRFPGKSQLRI